MLKLIENNLWLQLPLCLVEWADAALFFGSGRFLRMASAIAAGKILGCVIKKSLFWSQQNYLISEFFPVLYSRWSAAPGLCKYTN